MSDLLSGVLSILSQRSVAATQREIEAKGTYARFMLESPSDGDSPEAVIAAADELGIGMQDICRDLVTVKLAMGFAAQIPENDRAVADARAAILVAKRELTAARAKASHSAFDRANANLREKVSEAVALEEWGENLRKGVAFFQTRGQALKADMDAAAAAKRDAEQRKKQFAAAQQSPRAPADAAAPIAVAPTASDGPGDGTVAVTSVPEIEPAMSDGDATRSATERDAPELGEPIIPDLTPRPVGE